MARRDLDLGGAAQRRIDSAKTDRATSGPLSGPRRTALLADLIRRFGDGIWDQRRDQ